MSSPRNTVAIFDVVRDYSSSFVPSLEVGFFTVNNAPWNAEEFHYRYGVGVCVAGVMLFVSLGNPG